MPPEYIPTVFIYLVSALINATLALFTWKQREQQGAYIWVMVLLCIVLWSVASALILVIEDIVWKISMQRIVHIAVMSIVYFWVIFALRYSNHDHWLSPRLHLALAGISVTAYLIFLFDKSGIFYDIKPIVDPSDGLIKITYTAGPVALAWAIYGYLALLVSLILIVRRIQRNPYLYRVQSILIVAGVGLPLVANVLQFFGPDAPVFDITPVSFTVTGILMFIATQRFEFLRLVPVAYDTIYQYIGSGIIIINTRGRIVRMNPAAETILGVEQRTTIGAAINTLFPHHHEQIMRTTNEQPTNIELQIGTALRSYDMQVNTLNRPTRIGYVIMLFDITERKRAMEERSRRLLEEERTRILTTFMEKAAHEFRTPLSIIKSGQYLIGKTSDPEKIKMLIQRGDQQIDAVTQLVDKLLLITRIDNPHAALNLQPVDWNSFVQIIVDQQRPAASERNISLIYEVDAAKPMTAVDQELIAAAIRELLDNAIRYSPDGGQVTITCTAPQCTVKFIDSGKGIPESEQVRIFERFYRVDKSHNTRGFGLGLPIAQAVAGRHNGTVKLEQSTDKGSVFSLWIPPLTS